MHEKNHQRQVPFLTEQKRIVVVSGKGGVGKSFFSLHLAYALKSQNEKVLLIDSNLQNPSLHILTNSDTGLLKLYLLMKQLLYRLIKIWIY